MASATETVSKTKEASVPVRKTLTNWGVFRDAGLVPVRIRCEGYLGSHPADLSCHSNLLLTGSSVLSHMAPDHSGGWFKIKFRVSDGKVSELWQELEDAGVEIADLYCSHCRQGVSMTPRAMIKHLQNHAGATRINPDPQTLCFALSFNRADLDESLYEVAA